MTENTASSATNQGPDRSRVPHIVEAMQTAARQARLTHKQANQPLVVWRDGKIVLIPPDQIIVDENESAQ